MRRLYLFMADRFGYSRREARGMMAALALMLLFLTVPLVWRWWGGSAADPQALAQAEARADSALPGAAALTPVGEAEGAGPGAVGYVLRPFDPNTATDEDWQRMGAPAWLARRIGKYRAAGGYFKDVAGVGRIYDFPPELLVRLGPYMRFAARQDQYQAQGRYRRPEARAEASLAGAARAYAERPRRPAALVDINTADSAELERVYMIGPATAHGIVRYRALLGGYTRVEQLYELYNQDSARTAEFLPRLTVSPGYAPRRLDINALARDRSLYHPYLPRPAARLIRSYLQMHGRISSIDTLVPLGILKPAELERVRPYLGVED